MLFYCNPAATANMWVVFGRRGLFLCGLGQFCDATLKKRLISGRRGEGVGGPASALLRLRSVRVIVGVGGELLKV